MPGEDRHAAALAFVCIARQSADHTGIGRTAGAALQATCLRGAVSCYVKTFNPSVLFLYLLENYF